MFTTVWVEVFALLADVGLILFRQAGEQQPIAFIPIADAMVVKQPLGYKGWVFKLKHKDSEHLF